MRWAEVGATAGKEATEGGWTLKAKVKFWTSSLVQGRVTWEVLGCFIHCEKFLWAAEWSLD